MFLHKYLCDFKAHDSTNIVIIKKGRHKSFIYAVFIGMFCLILGLKIFSIFNQESPQTSFFFSN